MVLLLAELITKTHEALIAVLALADKTPAPAPEKEAQAAPALDRSPIKTDDQSLFGPPTGNALTPHAVLLGDRRKQKEAEKAIRSPRKALFVVAPKGLKPEEIDLKRNVLAIAPSSSGMKLATEYAHSQGLSDDTHSVYQYIRTGFGSDGTRMQSACEYAIGKPRRSAPAAEGKTNPADVSYEVSEEMLIQSAADSVSKLRRSDVDRVLEESPAKHRAGLAAYIKQNRPDLADEVDDVLSDLTKSFRRPPPHSVPESRLFRGRLVSASTSTRVGFLRRDNTPLAAYH